MATTSLQLQPASGHGWLTGFVNMIDKEYGSWWRTRRALYHFIMWLLIINGFLLLVGFDAGRQNPWAAVDDLIEVFFRVGGLFATIGVIVATQNTVLAERELGTAEWVLSKPVTREAFLLSKLLVNGLSFIGLAVLIPSVAFFLQTLFATYLQPDIDAFLLGAAFHIQQLLFYLALTMALGTFFNSRGAVSGMAIGLVFAGLILPNFFPWLWDYTPWQLPSLAYFAAVGRALPDGTAPVVILTGLYTLLLVLLAFWRFNREEF
ncbi:MAG: ABC transporter permease subunit [Gemmatimonadetes bacterium]|uniref:ABC transporter permease subunit n=1 Tax=Candidatus Kutchimonas denitrificans TaxID=3056748 RepID=A0AAE5C7L3_9BACT|nr:ABC transporter permease subunit [Gemmatimonadota bacterium]NIR73546.1 ABC transporter permease subunit [Candidatus Kutchimonas denitrificans]NIR99505.1 ABC transporter permease subunit [Gemmatimonadota bacterium]NIT65125.1 ABC transporter permease subunit [Gemmatimonadota bacterium]NIV23658.1 ABC transporter permease subunit [Gemmatimonadota bacterium]